MPSNHRTLEFLGKNYLPFNHFSEEILEKAKNSLRFFELKAGETLTLQACSAKDTLYITNGSANISFAHNNKVQRYQADQKKTIYFSYDQSPVKITTDVTTTICHADSALLNDFIFLQKVSNSSNTDEKDGFMQRLMFLKSTHTFRLLPLDIVEKVAHHCQEIQVKKDQEVIRQDMKADSFYILLEGEAEVWREEIDDDEPKMIGLLDAGDAFGEEELITGGARHATIKMTSNGRLLQLAKNDFEELVSSHALESVSPEVAKAMLSEGAQIIDVRFAEEYEDSFIPGSVLMPLPELRSHIPDLDKNKEYLILCAIGARAAAATLLLRQKSINARFIEGGIRNWPFPIAKNLELELILFDFCPYAQRCVISLLQNDTPCKLTYLDPDNLPDWFSEISPFGNVPILRIDGKTTIFESSIINEFIGSLSNSKMLPSNPVERGVSRSWTEFGSTLLSQVTGLLSVKTEAEFLEKRAALHVNLKRLEHELEGRGPYFTGKDFSLTDSTYAPLFMRMKHLNRHVALYQIEDFPLIENWAKQLLALDSVKNSTPKSFKEIYNKFIQRRGSGGWLGKKFEPAPINEEVFGMKDETVNHSLISKNTATSLDFIFKDMSCTVLNSTKLQIENINNYFDPDAMVLCKEGKINKRCVQSPQIIVEVLSNFTEGYDHGKKFAFYRQIDTLRIYIMLHQNQPLAEVFQRSLENSWLLKEYRGLEDNIPVGNELSLKMSDLYYQVDFEL